MAPKTRKRTSSTSKSTPSTSKSSGGSITPADVLAAGGVTDELIDPFVGDATDYDKDAFRTGIASYCRYLDSVNADERAAAMNVPIVEV